MYRKIKIGDYIALDVVEDENSASHYGTKRHSGRFPFGSGEDPYQHEDYLKNYKDLRSQGLTDNDIVKRRQDAIAKKLVESGMSESQASVEAKRKFNVTKLQAELSIAKKESQVAKADKVRHLMEENGNSATKVGKILGINESSVRSILNSSSNDRLEKVYNISELLKETIEKTGKNIDIGKGVEVNLGVSKGALEQAAYILEMEGYEVYYGRMNQANNPTSNNKTTLKVLCPPGTAKNAGYDVSNMTMVQSKLDANDLNYISIDDKHSTDGGKTFDITQPPESISSSRVAVRYSDEGGKENDGVIEIRRGVDDVSLGKSSYAQVRIAVDGSHYIKGMAIYGDDKDFPPGTDILINSNKPKGTPLLGPDNEHSVTKNFKKDKETGEIDELNPFGALVPAKGQTYYEDPNGKFEKDEKRYSLSVVNKVRSEGEWDSYSDSLATQFLAKQPKEIISSQLKLTEDYSRAEYAEIMSLTNPTIKKNLLLKYADECDVASYELKTASLPRQSWQVLLPVNSLKENEIFAPNYKDGEEVVLVRYPHEGIHEIPRLTVNNKNAEGLKKLGLNVTDAVGINAKTANALSGADFDGDTALVIPVNSKVKLDSRDIYKNNEKTRKLIEELDSFDTKEAYPGYPGMKVMKDTQKQMGVISNLITDMTVQEASLEEIVRATKHAMVVIDAEKHELDYRTSYKDNGIAELKAKYQGSYDEDGNYKEGASTLFSRAKREVDILERRGSYKIDEDGNKYYNESGRTYLKATIDSYNPDTGRTRKKTVTAWEENDGLYYKDSNGKKVKIEGDAKVVRNLSTQKEHEMLTVSDASKLYSKKPSDKEILYGEYANTMKGLANQARKDALSIKETNRDPEMAKEYADEVETLKARVRLAESNAPYEREAQRRANVIVNAKRESNPEMSVSEQKKAGTKALEKTRSEVGAHSTRITHITDREWEAIQKGAIGHTTLNDILKYMDDSYMKQLAMPKESKGFSNAQKIRLKTDLANGKMSGAELAEKYNISISALNNYKKEFGLV